VRDERHPRCLGQPVRDVGGRLGRGAVDYGYGGELYYPEEEVVIDGDGAETAVETPPSWTLDCEPNVIILGSTTYYQCGSAWYVRVYRGGDVAYTMVNPPPGY